MEWSSEGFWSHRWKVAMKQDGDTEEVIETTEDKRVVTKLVTGQCTIKVIIQDNNTIKATVLFWQPVMVTIVMGLLQMQFRFEQFNGILAGKDFLCLLIRYLHS